MVMDDLRDPITGMTTWRLFLDRLEHAVVRTQRRNQVLAVALIDIASHACTDDTVTVLPGDASAAAVGQWLQDLFRAHDTVALRESEKPGEFALILEDVTSKLVAAQIFNRLLVKSEEAVLSNGVTNVLSFRCGAVVSIPPHPRAAELLLRTRVAHDRALSRKRSTYVLFDRATDGAELDRRKAASGQNSGTLRKPA